MKNWLLSLLLFCSVTATCQDSTTVSQATGEAKPSYSGRKAFVAGLSVAGYGGSFLFLSQAWYKDYPRTSFHTFNDNGEWLQIDKVGHAWTTYHTSRLTTDLWKWAGVSPKNAVLLGTGSSLLYMLSIEYLDGHSAQWGWSWGDVGANMFGASLYAGQELTWKEQKVSLKFSVFPKSYAQPDLEQRADKLFGRSFQGRLLKDYNGQTYWLSGNLKSFFPDSNLPSWLNVSVGYGGDGMFGGYENIAKDKEGNITFDRRDIERYRQWYLAPDVDFTKIKTKSKALKTLFSAMNLLKFPAPALELSNGRLHLRAIAF